MYNNKWAAKIGHPRKRQIISAKQLLLQLDLDVHLLGAPATSLWPLLVALFLLGLGWNFAYVAASTLLSDQLSPPERAKTQGFNDLLLNLASAASQVGSGVVYASGGFGIMNLTAAAAALIPLALALWWQTASRRD